jgi:hypothetical protein
VDVPAERAEKAHYVAAHQWLTAGEAQLFDPQPDEGAAYPIELLEGEQLGFRQKRHFFRHAINAAEVAAVGHRHAQISYCSSKRIDHAWLARTTAYAVNVGVPPANVAPDLTMTAPRYLIGSSGNKAKHLALGMGRTSDCGQPHPVKFSVFLQIEDGDLDITRRLLLDETRDFAPQTGAILQDAIDIEPRLADCTASAVAGHSRRLLEVDLVMNDPRGLAPQSPSERFG